MQYIDVSGKLPMCCAANAPRMRYSAAYPTDAPAPQASGCLSEANPKGRKGPRESVSRKGLLYHGTVPIVFRLLSSECTGG